MYKGGPTYTATSAKIIRYAGLLIPVTMIVYGFLLQKNVILSGKIIPLLLFGLIAVIWLILAIIQFLMPSKRKLESGLRLVAYHLLAATYLVFVSGVFSPVLVFWIVLFIAGKLYFGNKGVILSVVLFMVVIGSDISMWRDLGYGHVILDLLSGVSILFTGLIVISINRIQDVSKNALDQSEAQLALQQDRITTIVNNLAVGVISTDTAGIIKVYNAASLNVIDTNDSLNGKRIDEVLSVIDQNKKPVDIYAEMKKAKSSIKRDDLIYSFSDGEEIRLEITYSPIRSNFSRARKAERNDGYVLIIRDVTKSKSLEEERDEFISVVSHELRTPLTIAEGSLSNVQLMMTHPDITHKMLSDSVDMAHEQVVFLANMVNDLSTLSRAERGVADTIELIDLKELGHKIHDEYNAEATAKKLRLDLDMGPTLGSVSASRLYLEELLQNFVTNAIKYTKEGNIVISLKQKNDIVTISVKDSGIGISKSDQVKIFDKFYRSEDYRTRETGGTGLGLYVASKLAHKLGTKINLTSRLNHGSTFSISLPIKINK